MVSFTSDYIAGAHPEVLRRLIAELHLWEMHGILCTVRPEQEERSTGAQKQ